MADKGEIGTFDWAVDAACQSEVGHVRPHNEDAVKVVSELGLFVVADGLGGHHAGERASEMAVETLEEIVGAAQDDRVVADAELLRRAFVEANKRILADAANNPGRAGMATTLTALLLMGSDYLIGHVGDSRAWRVRGSHGEQLTQDHSYVAEQLRRGTITAEQAEKHPYRHVLTRCLGNEPDLEVDVYNGTVQTEDVFVLASDGLINALDANGIAAIVEQADSAANATRRMVEYACQEDGRDNITAVTVVCHAP